jgi:hypothetical protein
MKRIAIKIDHTTRRSVHDGLGGVWQHGQEASLPDEVADCLVGMGLAYFVDGSSTIKAKAAHEVREAAAKVANVQAKAATSSSVYDQMPPEWRARVQDEGDEVIEEYLATLPAVSLEQYEASSADPFTVTNEAVMQAESLPKRRGRPPGSKNKPRATPIEGSDA